MFAGALLVLPACADDDDLDSPAQLGEGPDLGGDAGFDPPDALTISDAEVIPDAAADVRFIQVSSDFESGSVGRVRQPTDTSLFLDLADDNDDGSLPDEWRSWWYVRLDDVPTDEDVLITLGNRGWDITYTPVFSYDDVNWQRVADDDVTELGDRLRIRMRFEQPTVWLARFYPYTHSRMQGWLDGFDGSPFVAREAIGETPGGRPLELVTITDPGAPRAEKVRIWIHSRTHPAETGSSFLLEGLLEFLLSGEPDAQTALRRFVFSVVPMHNVDGVVVGNYRTTPQSENLENGWRYEDDDPFELGPRAPLEVHALRDAIAGRLVEPDPLSVTVAINLHSSNSGPDRPAFFFPHFGPEALGYTPDEALLWTNQVAFIDAVAAHYGEDLIDDVPAEGGRSFTANYFPETWWWLNRGPAVMAITLETVYGRAGFAPEWVTPAEMRDLGLAVGRALLDYHDR